MKILRYLGVAAAAGCLAAGCKEAELERWDSPASIYFAFATQGRALDNSTEGINMIRNGVDVADSLVGIPVSILGATVPYDRPIAVESLYDQTTNATEGVDYQFVETVIPANSTTGYVVVRLITTDNLHNAGDPGLFMKLKLVANRHFNTDYTDILDASAPKDPVTGEDLLDPRVFSIRYANAKEQSPLWNAVGGAKDMETYFGTWSNRKVLLMCDILNLSYDDFYPVDRTPQQAFDAMIGNPSAAMAAAYTLNRALEAYRRANDGADMKDEFGNMIRFGVTGW
jgi:hypothetical protein